MTLKNLHEHNYTSVTVRDHKGIFQIYNNSDNNMNLSYTVENQIINSSETHIIFKDTNNHLIKFNDGSRQVYFFENKTIVFYFPKNEQNENGPAYLTHIEYMPNFENRIHTSEGRVIKHQSRAFYRY